MSTDVKTSSSKKSYTTTTALKTFEDVQKKSKANKCTACYTAMGEQLLVKFKKLDTCPICKRKLI